MVGCCLGCVVEVEVEVVGVDLCVGFVGVDCC